MSLIVAARFDSFPEAEAAGRMLFQKGFKEEDVSIFFVNPAGQHARHAVGGDQAASEGAKDAHKGAMIGAATIAVLGAVLGAAVWMVSGIPLWALIIFVAVGAYIGSLGGAMVATKQNSKRPARPGQDIGMRRAGVLTSVRVVPDTETLASQILLQAGGKDIERAGGQWKNGDWVDFDATNTPVLSDKVPAKATE